MKRVAVIVAIGLTIASCAGRAGASEIVIGAVYPTSGGQGQGGLDEFRGAELAAEYVNARGGVNGARVRLQLRPADTADAAPGAVRALAGQGVPAIIGTHGSTMARPAAIAAADEGVVFWETGAIGPLGMGTGETPAGPTIFRFAPTGATLGRSAVSFAIEQLLPKLGRDPTTLRYASLYVDDEYGRSVGLAASDEVRARGLTLAGDYPYTINGFEARSLVRRVARARPDVLFVAAYLDDGVAVRKQLVRQRVPLVASVGTSSSYCMHEFGLALGKRAVGLFASDKPDGSVIDASRLDPTAAAALDWARAEWERRYDDIMHAGALTGFAGALALMAYVLPEARSLTPVDIAAAARRVTIDPGGLPNGSGLAFGQDGENRNATSVIWEWVAENDRQVVWPPAFATHPIVATPL